MTPYLHIDNWFTQCRDKNIPASGTIQQAKHALKTLRHFVETTTGVEDRVFFCITQ